MKLAVLVPVRIGGSGGLIKHIKEVVPRWLKCNRVELVSLITPEGIFDEMENIGVQLCQVSRKDYRTGFKQMGKLFKEGGYEVAFSTLARPVKIGSFPIVTMVRNIEPIQKSSYKMSIKWRIRLLMLRREHSIACKQATRILAVSCYVKDELRRRFRIQSNKIDVVYHGLNYEKNASSRKPSLNICEGDFIFCAGSVVPYRGYEDIIRAVGYLRSNRVKSLSIVLAGDTVGHANTYEQSLRRLAKKYKMEDAIIWAGHLEQDEMMWCFQNSKLFVQTSRAEACPNIALEAMGHGALCVSCDHPPMPEIFQDASLFYPMGNMGVLADRIIEVIDMTREETEAWRAKSRQRASFFSWDKTADQTLDVLESAIKDHHRSGDKNVC